MSDDTCAMPRCRRFTEVYFYGKPMCDYHWTRMCDGDLEDVYMESLGIKRKPDEEG